MDKFREEDNAFEDCHIVKDILTGHPEKFELLVAKYKNLVFNLVLRTVIDYDEVEDLVQDIFYKVFRGLSKFDLNKKFYSWLYTIAINTIRNHLKRKRLRQMVFLRPTKSDTKIVENLRSDDYFLQSGVFEDELKSRVADLLLKLKDKYRLVIVLHYFDSLNIKEISDILKLPENTVKTHLRRARKDLLHLIRASKKSETFFREACEF